MTANPYSDKIVHGNSLEIAAETTTEKNKSLIEPGSHNLLIYNDLKAFREIYTQYSRALLPQNEIVVISTQYEPINDIKNTLRLSGVNVERYLNQGTLFILDAQRGYHGAGTHGMWKFALSLLIRVKKEGRQGVTWIGDVGSFFGFEKIEQLMQYELSLPQKYEDTLKVVCSYHLKDFEQLNENQKQTLFDHHFKSILIE